MSAAIVKLKPKGSDPAYPAIKAHRAAIAALSKASHVSCRIDYGGPGGSPSYWAAQDKTAKACDQLSAALCELLACQPTTMAGLLAMLDYIAMPEWLDDDTEGNTILASGYTYGTGGLDEAKNFPRTIAAALRKMIGGVES
jgi:hypothetical protein